MPVIWIPDGEPFEVEWYTSEGKATGVQRISEHFMAHRVGPKRDTGFRPDAVYEAWREKAAENAPPRDTPRAYAR